MNVRVSTMVLAVAMIGLPAACGKDGGGGGKSKRPTPTATPAPSNPPAKAQTATPQSQQAPNQNWEDLANKALAFQQSVGADSSKLRFPFIYETYFQNGQVNSSADRTPKDVNGTLCYLKYSFGTTKSKTAIDAGSRFVVSQATPSESTSTYNEAILKGEMQGGTNDKLSEIVCRKHVDAGTITRADLETAFGGYVQIQGQ